MSWGKPINDWAKQMNQELLPDGGGCHLCFAFEKVLSGDKGTFILQHHSPDISCECQNNPAAECVTHHGLEATCEAHAAMMVHVLKMYGEFSAKMMAAGLHRREYPAHGVSLSRPDHGNPKITILDDSCVARESFEFILRKPPNSPISIDVTTIDTSWINLDLAIRWKDKCINDPGSKCALLNETSWIIPDLLIDAKEGCIVRGEASMEYVALSYRWGKSVWSGVSLDHLDELQTPGSLTNSSISKLPLIKHAISLVKKMDERYLWIDAVCIIQEEKGHLAHQLQHMGAIYSSAKITVMLTDGDAMTGIPGLQGCSAPRGLAGVFQWTNNREIYIRDIPHQNHSLATDYFKRGWTFQEYVLSTRRLIIGKNQIHWSCSCGTFHEDLPYVRCPPIDKDGSIEQAAQILRRRPDFKAFNAVVRAYNNLELNRVEDALPAIAGLLGAISPYFKGGFLYGLPVMCFEAGLLWGSKFWYHRSAGINHQGLERRESSGENHSLLPDSGLPSWSWVSWKSNSLDILSDEEDHLVVTYPPAHGDTFTRTEKWVTVPTTEWFCHDDPKSTTKYRLRSSWFEPHVEISEDQELPKDWAMGKYLNANGIDVGNIRSLPHNIPGQFVYHHHEFPDRLFWRPFPASPEEEDLASGPMKQCKFISCKTKRGRFRCFRTTGVAMEAGGMDYHLQVLNNHAQISGWIQLADENAALPNLDSESRAIKTTYSVDSKPIKMVQGKPSLRISIPGHDSLVNLELVELVLICERLFSESIDYEARQWRDKRAYRAFCAVLCVEWIDGVAYRKGYGYVAKETWDQYDVEDVDLVLG